MRTRAAAILVTAVVVVYLVLLAGRAWALFESGDPVGIALGAGVLILPLVGLWIVAVNLRFGARTERLARRLAEEGGLPDTSDLPRRPSGRVERDAADAWFAQRQAETEAAPDDWRNWYRLAHGYDIAGDRRRAREAMRRAIDLEATANTAS
ncbi:hypothetical protein [Goodfellowiella coeruleoviolacea]|uniref:Tetratricopeptide repeat protein n=1 Tax=Goodfellowiella coeruleoviolacea TaxID=334858 RepID=A0AAE3GP50_9PSEU|nr:hypothetical protein [Goodfellowiella coeruleoviolacea]MCP2169603.1 hypothetical protein [Goodfellowiella coeruleoviolacea]